MQSRIAGMLCAGAALFVASQVSANIIVGTTSKAAGSTGAFYLDTTTGVATPLWNAVSTSGTKVNGLVADDANGRVLLADSAAYGRWNYGTAPNPPGIISAFVRTSTTGNGFAAVGVDDLTSNAGHVYGWQSFTTTSINHGVFEVPPPDVNGRSLLGPAAWQDLSNNTYYFKGIAYDTDDGNFYGTQIFPTGSATAAVAGLYRLNASDNTATFVKSFPVNPNASVTQRTEIDGLAYHGGKFWMSEKDRNSSNIFVYSLDSTTLNYDPTIFTIPLADSAALSSDLDWTNASVGTVVPEPTSLALLGGLLSVAGMRRRSR